MNYSRRRREDLKPMVRAKRASLDAAEAFQALAISVAAAIMAADVVGDNRLAGANSTSQGGE
ncbi:MAG TPA: hypothetical protein VKS78_17450 [Roseiarcus sp.]|nr:hypothetical protein [Roseiarcus sp.]